MALHDKPTTIKDVDGLLQSGLVTEAAAQDVRRVAEKYDIGITPAFQALIQTPDDAIGRQVVPTAAELAQTDFQREDPIGDQRYAPVKGVVHRYEDRALLTPLLICPIYCRFCFRRERVGTSGGLLTDAELEGALDWFRRTPTVREAILTGGDPFMLSPRRLKFIVSSLAEIAHIDVIRIHTRVPVADPRRITPELLDALACEKSIWVVAHVNHARELTTDAAQRFRAMRERGVSVLSQSVLLRGVNDTLESMENLLRSLVGLGVKPYYLHHLDPAPGTEHFRVPIHEGLALMRGLRGRVTGLAWPTYVLDIPGGAGKVPLGPHYLDPEQGDHISDPGGQRHVLPGANY